MTRLLDVTAPEEALLVEPRLGYDATKRVIDVSIAIGLLVMLAPLMVFVMIAIKLESPGPVFFRQRRVGRDEHQFTLVKFRSMCVDAEAIREDLRYLDITGGPTFKAVNDPRLTRTGKLIRRFSLDELPQLLNVVRGEMSLVGPRPMLDHEVGQLSSEQRRRFLVKPGLTCIWQVSGRSTIGFDRWMEMDNEYVERRSLWLDLWLIARTPIAVLTSRGAY